jgi:competence ComEA-like helix-hairpin-helix protein
MVQRTVNSWEQLQANIESILDQINDNPPLALAAAANPLLALEDLGYEIEPVVRVEIERRVRFSPRVVVRLRQLEDDVATIAGRYVNLNSAEDVRRLLFDELKLETPGEYGEDYRQATQTRVRRTDKAGRAVLDTRPLPPDLSTVGERIDPLEVLANRHEIMGPLLEYRRLEASTPRLASRESYEQVRAGKVRLGIEGVKGRLKVQVPPRDDGPPADDTVDRVLNLNKAAAADLEQIPGIGPALAERIVLYRTAYGPFSDVDMLTEIKGIGPDLLGRVRHYLTV